MGYYTFGSWVFHPYSDWNVRRRGALDGSLKPPIPVWNTELQPPFIMQLKQVVDSHIYDVSTDWARRDQKLKPQVKELDRMCEETKRRIAVAEQENQANHAYYESLHNAPPPSTLTARFTFYMILLSLLVIFELPMNSIVFRLFGEGEVFTYIAAFAVGLSLVVCAHYLGELLREGDFRDRTNRIVIATLIAIPAVVVASVAYLREAYIQSNPDTFQKLSPGMLLVAFVGFNFIIYAVGTIASYRFHDQGLKAVLKSKRNLRRANAAHESREATLARIKNEREKLFYGYQAQAGQFKEAVQRLTDLYRTHNLAARADRGDHPDDPHPRSFGHYPEPSIPPNLIYLDPPEGVQAAGLTRRVEV